MCWLISCHRYNDDDVTTTTTITTAFGVCLTFRIVVQDFSHVDTSQPTTLNQQQ